MFLNARSGLSVQKLFKKLKLIYDDIKLFARAGKHDLVFNFSDEEGLLRDLSQKIKELKDKGVSLQINAWQLFVFLRLSWYHWMRARHVNSRYWDLASITNDTS